MRGDGWRVRGPEVDSTGMGIEDRDDARAASRRGPPNLDGAPLEALAHRAAGGNERACRELMDALAPHLLPLVHACRAFKTNGVDVDGAHAVVLALVEKLARRDGAGLSRYPSWQERNEDKTFGDWLRIVVANAVRDQVRRERGVGPSGLPSIKRLFNEFVSSPLIDELGIRPPITAAQTARELLEYAARELPVEQHSALTSWIEGASFTAIAAENQLDDAEHARRLLRAAVATLRRRFASAKSSAPGVPLALADQGADG